jgi:hypothetical protein
MKEPGLRVELAAQVVEFVRCQPPERRHRLRMTLRKLAHEQGDIRALEGPLSGFFRLPVGAFRILFAYAVERNGKRIIRCLFAEQRSVVYLLMEEMLRKQIVPGE